MMRHCIDDYQWSPFMYSYHKRSCLTNAIMGNRKKLIELLLSLDYKGDDVAGLENLYQGKDIYKRGPMHYAYILGDEDIIFMLKEAGFSKKSRRDVYGFFPDECRH
jgi:hypothetical protein